MIALDVPLLVAPQQSRLTEHPVVVMGRQHLPPVQTPEQQLALLVQASRGARQVQVPLVQIPLQHCVPTVQPLVLLAIHETHVPPTQRPLQQLALVAQVVELGLQATHVPLSSSPEQQFAVLPPLDVPLALQHAVFWHTPLQQSVLSTHRPCAGWQAQTPPLQLPLQHWVLLVHV